jgi:hypothetical protein
MDSVKMKTMLTDIKAVLNITPNKRFDIYEKVKITLEHTTGQRDSFTLLAIRLDNNNQLVIQCSRGIVIYPEKNILPYEVIKTLFNVIVSTNQDVVFEYCPFCENEAIIPYKRAMGTCNHCGRPLAPCAHCADMNEGKIDCSTCEFNHKNNQPMVYMVKISVLSKEGKRHDLITDEEFKEFAQTHGIIIDIDNFTKYWNLNCGVVFEYTPKNSIIRIF